jgi:hypothetical protein
MAVGDEDHSRIAMAVAAGAGCCHELVHLVGRQVLAGASVRILATAQRTYRKRLRGDYSEMG